MDEFKGAIGRRTIVAGLAGALAAPAVVRAQGTYPNKTVRYINPFPAGGATDTLSRIFCAKISELSGQQWIVENKGGSGGNVGIAFAVPSETVKTVIAALKENGSVERGYLGVQIQPVTQDIADSLALKDTKGALMNMDAIC